MTATRLCMRRRGKNAAEVAKVLIANDADVNAKNKKGETPLYVATREESAEVKKLLTDNGATF